MNGPVPPVLRHQDPRLSDEAVRTVQAAELLAAEVGPLALTPLVVVGGVAKLLGASWFAALGLGALAIPISLLVAARAAMSRPTTARGL